MRNELLEVFPRAIYLHKYVKEAPVSSSKNNSWFSTKILMLNFSFDCLQRMY